jgi:uncharacterized membrane protein
VNYSKILRSLLLRFWRAYSVTGLLTGTLFFAFSLTPSLIPREAPVQGLLSGIALACGYGLGVFGLWLWRYLELPYPRGGWESRIKSVAMIASAGTAAGFLWKAAEWQDGIRRLMQMEPLETAQPLLVGSIALMVFIFAILLARLFVWGLRNIANWLNNYLPRRFANVVGFLIAGAIMASLADGLIFKTGLRALDEVYENLDALIDAQSARPPDASATGSSASQVEWASLGRRGRDFISTGPSGADIASLTGRPALDPIRVYVGLRSAETPQDRASLALRELISTGAFERTNLIIAMPTGTGWMDPAAVDSVEYLHNGDTAIVGAQYSYLASWLSLLVEPGYGKEMARALFTEVYQYWTNLSENKRPKLYLHGLSLGALSSESSAELFEVIGDPYHGAMWAGPPFASSHWRALTDGRNEGLPAWLPQVGDSSFVRFTGQQNVLDIPGAKWGPLRIVYLQYASDPITFFEISSLYRRPSWLVGGRGPDVSEQLRWYPVVTFLQTLVDMMIATTAPTGYGHVYAPEHYIDAWLAVTQPRGWSAEALEKLKGHFAGQSK